MGAAASLAGVLNAFLQRSSHGDGGRQLQEWQQCCSIGAAALRSIACTGSTQDMVAACVQPQRSKYTQSAARRAAQPDPLLSAIVVAVEATRVSKRNLGCAALQQP